MKKIKSGTIELKKIKHIENSRLRSNDDVSDLMRDIEQRGLLQPIGVRIKDKALIYGNRRVKAYEKLGYDTIPCEFYDEINDDELIIVNAVENIKRKNIGTIEIGRVIELLQQKGMTNSEISERLGISKNRVKSCLSSYEITKNTPFMKLVNSKKTQTKMGISESTLWALGEAIRRSRPSLNKEEWLIILKNTEEGKLHTNNIGLFKNLLLSNPDKNIKEIINIIEDSEIINLVLSVDKFELTKEKRKLKLESGKDFIKYLILKHNDKLLF